MERLRSGFGAVRTALQVSRSRPRLLALPLANVLAVAVLTVAAFLATGHLEPALEAGTAAGLGVPLLSTTLTAGFGALVGVAVAHVVATASEDDPAGLRDGLAVAWSVKWAALAWGLLTAAVGRLVDVVAATAVAQPAGLLFTVPWTLATLFVVPALALDRAGLGTALSRNLATLRRHPVESAAALAGALAVGAPLAAVGAPAAATVPASGAVDELAVKLAGVALLVVAAVLVQVLVVAAGVALYRDTDRRDPDRRSTTPAATDAAES
jgi:hypothetical protein